jgi:hypothetical protein
MHYSTYSYTFWCKHFIQVDIGGHPPFPTGSKQFSGNFGNLLFLAVFLGPKLLGRFEALNDVFWENGEQHIFSFNVSHIKSCIPRIDLSNGVSSTPNGDRMQKLRPREVDVSTTSIEAHKPFGFSSSGVRVLDFPYVKKALRASL